MRATIAQEFRRVHRCLCLSAAAAASAEALLHRATGETRPVAYGTLVGGSPRRSLPLLGGTGRRLGCIDMHERSTGDARAGAGLWRILDV